MHQASGFEHFISTYLGPICSFLGLLAMGGMAAMGWKLDARFAKFREEIMSAINGKYLHSEVANAKFEGIEGKLDQLGDMFTQYAFGDNERRAKR